VDREAVGQRVDLGADGVLVSHDLDTAFLAVY